MLFDIIMLGCFYPVLLIMHLVMKNESKPKGNVVFGVTLPKDKVNTEEITRTVAIYKKRLNICGIILFILPLSIIPVKGMSIPHTLYVVWATMIILVYMYEYARMNKKVKVIKYENNWVLEKKNTQLVDLKAASERRKAKILFYIPALIISFIPFLYELICSTKNELIWIYLIVLGSSGFATVIFSIIGWAMVRTKPEIISDNSDVNANYARVKSVRWDKCFIICSWINTFYTLYNWIFVREIISSIVVYLIVSLIYTVLLILEIFKTEFDIRKIHSGLVVYETIPEVDDDECWVFGMFYYNPQDNRSMIPKRFGIGSTVNMAKPAGKITALILIISVASIPVCCIWSIFAEYTPLYLKVENSHVIAGHMSENCNIDIDDIDSIKVIDEFPKATKKMGTNFENLYTGQFDVEGYGYCDISLRPKAKEFIVIEVDKYIYILSGQDDKETQEVYEELIDEQ